MQVGPCLVRLLRFRMPRPRLAARRKVKVAHLKYAAITTTTVLKYRRAIRFFFLWPRRSGLAFPTSHAQLDAQLAEFLNFLYQDDYPMYWGANALSGFKRLYPACRRHLDLSALYYRNWTRTIVRARAFPL